MRHPSLPEFTINDGFRFGCGFWAAGFLFFAVFLPLAAIAGMLSLALFSGVLSAITG